MHRHHSRRRVKGNLAEKDRCQRQSGKERVRLDGERHRVRHAGKERAKPNGSGDPEGLGVTREGDQV